jgi:hypothetical protein
MLVQPDNSLRNCLHRPDCKNILPGRALAKSYIGTQEHGNDKHVQFFHLGEIF